MAGFESRESDPREPLALDAALRAIPDPPIPDGLLEACLATVPAVPRGRVEGDSSRGRMGWKLAAAAAVLLAVFSHLARSRHADAAELLRQSRQAWTAAPASHSIIRRKGPTSDRTEETWVVRHKGLRKEVRAGGELVAVVVRNDRWEFRWDVPGRTVAAWSTALSMAHRRPSDEGLVLDRDEFEAWARSHRGELALESDTIAGRAAQKVVLRWPGAAGASGIPPTTIVWFDAKTRQPLKQRSEHADGTVTQETMDYPPADAIPDDLFHLEIPGDALLEVNDPDLGRQLYSTGQVLPADTSPAALERGAER
ncbi:MAG: hypothetical protein U0790_27795 [Isosphaeraceae bacterium]